MKALAWHPASERFERSVGSSPITNFQDWLLKPLGQLAIYAAVFGGNGKTQIYSGGVSSILDSLQTIIGNILRFVDFGVLFRQPVEATKPLSKLHKCTDADPITCFNV